MWVQSTDIYVTFIEALHYLQTYKYLNFLCRLLSHAQRYKSEFTEVKTTNLNSAISHSDAKLKSDLGCKVFQRPGLQSVSVV